MLKKEIFEIPVISYDSENFAKSLKVEIKVTRSNVKLKSFRDFLGSISEQVIDALKSTKAYISNDGSNLQFIYPEMDEESRKVIKNLFLPTEDFKWKKDLKLKGYLSKPLIINPEKLYPNFIGTKLFGNTSGLFTGTIEFRVTKK